MDIEERRNRKSQLRRLELIAWLIILLFVGILCVFLHIRHENSFVTHTIYMPDVDGLIVGSPVQLMGISIGYVDKVKILTDNEIKVRFKITNKTIHLPKQTFATVEFSGLGGSKALVLYTPDSGKYPKELVGKNDYILVDRPRRLRDSMVLLYQMYKTLMDIIYTSANFSNRVENIDTPDVKGDFSNIDNFLDYADKYLDNYNNSMKQIRSMIFKGKYAR